MNILVVSKSFYPQNSPRSFRTTALVKEFSKQGHKVTLLTFKDDVLHKPFEKEYNIKIKDLGKRKYKEINYNSKIKLISMTKRFLRRVLLQVFEYPNIELTFLVRKALKVQSNYDLLISIAAPHTVHWGVAWARKTNHNIAKIWVADCGDPYYLNVHDSFKKLFYFKYLEKWFSKKADYITMPFIGLKKYFFKEFEKKYKAIPQGFDFKEVNLFEKSLNNDVVTFGFAGGFMKNSRDPRKFFDYLLTVKTPFRFILFNRQVEFTNPYKKILGNKLIINDYIPRDKLLYELSKMDFLVNFEFDDTNQIPSKLIDYSLTRRPILLIKNKEFKENTIDEFLSKEYKNQFKLAGLEKYKIENVAQSFLKLASN